MKPRMTFHTLCFCLVLCVVQSSAAKPAAAFKPENPRCEFLADPVGIDVGKPRLMWKLAALDPKARDLRESACQILVASTPEKLARGEGDLWDSGKTARGDVPMLDYAGKPLTSRQACYWKVRAWDQDGKPSGWSAPAKWTMGLLERADWRAQWISDPADAASRQKLEMHWGYHSAIGTANDEVKWVQVDLGKPFPIDSIRLYPAHAPWVSFYLALYFPQRFRIEASNKADFSDATVLVDRTAADEPLPETWMKIFATKPCVARYVRLTATQLSSYNGKDFGLALGELEVLDSERNRALGCEVTAKDSLIEPGWSPAKLTDGNRQQDRSSNWLKPAAYLRKDFQVVSQVRRAVVFATALGTYELRINGKRVGDAQLAPEFTRWVDRVQYQAYDVTSLLRPGANTIAAVLAEGWYAGRVWPKATQPPEDFPRLLAQLDIEKKDGSLQQICSDGTWRSTNDGPIRSAGLYDGEDYDATREIDGWDAPGFADAGWASVQVEPLKPKPTLSRQPNEPIRVMKEFPPVAITEPEPGVYVVDFGQNLVGWCRAGFEEEKGAVISLRHAEVLDSRGMLDQNSLDHAFANDYYTCRGQGRETFEPHFTYHGFRYLELRGLSKPPRLDDLTACALHSGVPTSGRFESSNELLSRIMHAAEWTQRGNLTGVPTDCPQRSERNGWMGDFQTASQAFLFNLDLSAFFSKWIRDIRDSQAEDGRFAELAPMVLDLNIFNSANPAWADGGVIVPWRAYVNYGDRRLLEEHYESARRWVDYLAERNPDRVWEKVLDFTHYGDWQDRDVASGTGGSTPIEVFATCFWAHTSGLVANMAEILGKTDDAQKYAQLSSEIKAAFQKRYIQPDGTIRGNSQSVYTLALHFGLLTPEQQEQALANLLVAIKRNNGRMTSGMQSAHRMLLELSARGFHEEAFRMVMLRDFPSYGYMMDQGATTIWEGWETHRAGNSWNHPAFSAVAEWAWRTLAGINPSENPSGYKHFVLRPLPAGDLQWVKASYESPYGTIRSAWKREGERFTFEVTVPPDSTAEVVVPTADGAAVTESGKPAQPARTEPGRAVFAVGSGNYLFESQLPQLGNK